VSFYYIDGAFQHALATVHLGRRWDLVPYEPALAELILATRFLDYRPLPYGIVRLDFARTVQHEFLLMEIEDWCPFLSLLDTPRPLRDRFIQGVIRSLQIVLANADKDQELLCA